MNSRNSTNQEAQESIELIDAGDPSDQNELEPDGATAVIGAPRVPSPGLSDRILATCLVWLSHPIIASLSAVSSIAALLTFVDLIGAIFSPSGLEELLLLMQFSWLGLLFPSSLATAIGIPWENNAFSQFIVAFFRFCFLMLVGGSILCLNEIRKNTQLSLVSKILWAAAICFSTLIICPVAVPAYLLINWMPDKRRELVGRMQRQTRILIGEDMDRMKLQLLILSVTLGALLLFGYFVNFPVGRLFG